MLLTSPNLLFFLYHSTEALKITAKEYTCYLTQCFILKRHIIMEANVYITEKVWSQWGSLNKGWFYTKLFCSPLFMCVHVFLWNCQSSCCTLIKTLTLLMYIYYCQIPYHLSVLLKYVDVIAFWYTYYHFYIFPFKFHVNEEKKLSRKKFWDVNSSILGRK